MCLFFRFSLIRDEDDELLFHTSMRIEHADGCCINLYIFRFASLFEDGNIKNSSHRRVLDNG